MFSYVINDSNSEKHFNKAYGVSDLKGSLMNGIDTSQEKHVYRIKDLTDAINTSVLLDLNQKETYNEWLTSERAQFDANDEFVNICREVGECDVN